MSPAAAGSWEPAQKRAQIVGMSRGDDRPAKCIELNMQNREVLHSSSGTSTTNGNLDLEGHFPMLSRFPTSRQSVNRHFKPTISKLSSDPMQGGRQRVSNRVQQPPSPNAQTTSLCSFYNSSMFPHSLSFPPLLCSCFVRYNILLELCVPSYLYGILVCNLWNKDYLFAFLAPKSER